MTVMSEEKVKLLGIHKGNRLNFDYHISQLFKNAGEKLHALTRVLKYMNISQRKLIANAFIISQFSFCPLIWMFHSRVMDHIINLKHKHRIYERNLRLIYPNQHQLTFKELIEEKKTVRTHQRNLQILATDIYKP